MALPSSPPSDNVRWGRVIPSLCLQHILNVLGDLLTSSSSHPEFLILGGREQALCIPLSSNWHSSWPKTGAEDSEEDHGRQQKGFPCTLWALVNHPKFFLFSNNANSRMWYHLYKQQGRRCGSSRLGESRDGGGIVGGGGGIMLTATTCIVFLVLRWACPF